MSRNPQLEAVFKARYAWENSVGDERVRHFQQYRRLLDEALLSVNLGIAAREELEDALMKPYREFRRAKLREERAKLSRLR
jgi:hypothetical protein